MPKIDISSWGEFRIGDLFTQERGKESSPNRVEDGTLPMVNEINTNNGIAKFGKSSNVILGNCITVSVNYATNVFYQKDDFCASVNILVLRSVNINEYSGKFISGILSRNNLKYDYTNKISKDRLNDEIIKLPTDSKGDPDWQYMEEYMRNIEVRVSTSISKLESAQGVENSKINISGWGEFRLGKLLNLKTGETKGTGIFNIINSVPYHGKDIEEIEESNTDGLNYVTRSKFNNGIKCKVLKKETYIINPAGTISFGAENADFFYQTEEYITGNKMYYIDTSDLSKYSCAFLKSVLEATFTANFSFSDGMTPTRIYDAVINLPIDSNGEPDWLYMENYMKALEIKVKGFLDKTV